MKDNWISFDTEKSLYEELARELLSVAEDTINNQKIFNIVITGGKSILGLYQILSEADSDFKKWQIYLSDERYLPMGHPDRNEEVIYKTWLKNNRVPKENINFVSSDLDLDSAREDYEIKIDKVTKFDVVLLSVGADGHIASLFPGRKYKKNESVIIERFSPKPPKERISISFERLNNTKFLYKVIIGESKRSVVRRLLNDERLPANFIKGKKERVFIHKDLIS